MTQPNTDGVDVVQRLQEDAAADEDAARAALAATDAAERKG